VGANKLVGLSIEQFTQAVDYFNSHPSSWENPLGDGHTSDKILEVILSKQ
jgi:UDP-N-acetylglucosamine 2-epimerase